MQGQIFLQITPEELGELVRESVAEAVKPLLSTIRKPTSLRPTIKRLKRSKSEIKQPFDPDKGSVFHNGNFIFFHRILYQLNHETNWYIRQSNPTFTKLPNELKVERTVLETIRCNGAENIITGKVKGGRRDFFTGLQPTDASNLFRGNALDKSEVLFYFRNSFQELEVYYFNEYRLLPPQRKGFHEQFVTQVLIH